MEKELKDLVEKTENFAEQMEELQDKIDNIGKAAAFYAAVGGFLGFSATILILKFIIALSHI